MIFTLNAFDCTLVYTFTYMLRYPSDECSLHYVWQYAIVADVLVGVLCFVYNVK